MSNTIFHSSHETRFSFDASSWDDICVFCGLTAGIFGNYLKDPCIVTEEEKKQRRWDIKYGNS